MQNNIEEIQKTYPFLSLIAVAKEEYVGIIQNSDTRVLSLYRYDIIPHTLKSVFLEFGSNWWWESNRKIPINIFIGKDFNIFRPYLKTYSIKETKILFGPIIRLGDLNQTKRTRVKTVQLLRTIK